MTGFSVQVDDFHVSARVGALYVYQAAGHGSVVLAPLVMLLALGVPLEQQVQLVCIDVRYNWAAANTGRKRVILKLLAYRLTKAMLSVIEKRKHTFGHNKGKRRNWEDLSARGVGRGCRPNPEALAAIRPLGHPSVEIRW